MENLDPSEADATLAAAEVGGNSGGVSNLETEEVAGENKEKSGPSESVAAAEVGHNKGGQLTWKQWRPLARRKRSVHVLMTNFVLPLSVHVVIFTLSQVICSVFLF